MMKVVAYIISWINPNWTDKEKEKRKKTHHKQVKHLIEDGVQVKIFAQYFTDRIEHPLVEYLPYDGKRYFPGAARNECLKHFYSSDYDYAFMLDDDTVYYPYFKKLDRTTNIVSDFEKYGQAMLDNNVHIISISHNRYYWYLNVNRLDKQFPNKLVFTRQCKMGGNICIANFKKHFNEEFWYINNTLDETGTLVSCEDIEFALSVIKAGHGGFMQYNWYIVDESYGVSTYRNESNAQICIRNGFNRLTSIYNKFNVPFVVTKNKRFFGYWRKWQAIQNIPKEVIIDRSSK